MIKYTKYLLVSLLLFVGVAQAQETGLSTSLFRGGKAYYSVNNSAIVSSTADGADNLTLNICGGGDTSVTRGGCIGFHGNEVGGSNHDGSIILQAGTGTYGWIMFNTVAGGSSLTRWTIDSSGNLQGHSSNGGDLIMGKTGTSVRPGTDGNADLGDSSHGFGALYLSNGSRTGSLTFDGSSRLTIESEYSMIFKRNGTALLAFQATELSPVTDGGYALGEASFGFKALYLYDGSTLPTCSSEGLIAIDGDSDCAGGAANGAICVCDGSNWVEVVKW